MSKHPDILPGLTGGDSLAPGSTANVDLLAGTLAVRRFCHGLLRFSIYPDSYHKNARDAKVGIRRMCQRPDREAHDIKLRKIDRGYAKDMEQATAGRCSALSDAKNFNGDMQKGHGKKYRKKAFTYNGALVVNEVGQVAEEKYGKSGLFLTGTIPGTGAHINAVIADYSSFIVNRVKQWFRRWFSQDYSEINVWELQKKKRVMLHIHIAVFSHEIRVLEKIKNEWKKRWESLLLEVSRKSGVDVFRKNERKTWKNDLSKTRQDAQWISKSVTRYLAKYLSKGARENATHSSSHPSRWWGVDRKTAREARERRLTLRLRVQSLADAKQILGCLFGQHSDALEGVNLEEHEKAPGVVSGGKFLEPEQSKSIWIDMFLKLSTEYGAQLCAE